MQYINKSTIYFGKCFLHLFSMGLEASHDIVAKIRTRVPEMGAVVIYQCLMPAAILHQDSGLKHYFGVTLLNFWCDRYKRSIYLKITL